ncbi:MAG: DUF1559 family PulG-like putative transporter [Armatimonadota bacterium]
METGPKKREILSLMSLLVFPVGCVVGLAALSVSHNLDGLAIFLASLLLTGVLGIVGAVRVRRGGETLRGFTVWEWLGMYVATLLLWAVLFPVFVHPNEDHERTARCQSNLKQLSLALLMYSNDYGTLPDPSRWNEAIAPYVKNPRVFTCRSVPDASEPTYAMNELLGKVDLGKLKSPSEVLMLFESEPGRNAHGGKAYLLQCPTRHDGGMNTAFADSHVKWYKKDDLTTLNLMPEKE